MEAAMGEYQADAGPMDALGTHLKAIRTESARIDPKARRAAVLETLPERTAALTSRVAAKLEARERDFGVALDQADECCGPD
jgi:hypothetical protein